jgi:hypothetical protein
MVRGFPFLKDNEAEVPQLMALPEPVQPVSLTAVPPPKHRKKPELAQLTLFDF